ncbi:MAG: hypothetical protein HYS07_00580 [Chlamydiae bacterium]|nr:hypothetical protein [Chlamydiota bacterium]MBI3278155.1 hypothetical protein [Chlamydiota bacterium]
MLQKYLKGFNFFLLAGLAALLILKLGAGSFSKGEDQIQMTQRAGLHQAIKPSFKEEASLHFKEPILGGASLREKESVPIQFLGTASAGSKIFGVLSYQDHQSLVQEGEEIGGWHIKHLSEEEVLLENSSGETIRRSHQIQERELPLLLQKTDENHWILDSNSLKDILKHWAELLTEVRILPLFESGRAQGYEFLNVRPESRVEKLGFRTGDVIQRINGRDVTDLSVLLSLQNEWEQDNLVVDVKRGAKNIQLIYQKRDDKNSTQGQR